MHLGVLVEHNTSTLINSWKEEVDTRRIGGLEVLVN
jgi:hypothetical protein